MMSSRNTTCTGEKMSGQRNSSGNRVSPMMGVCTAKMYATAFFRLS